MSRQYASQLLFEVKPSKNYLYIVTACALLSVLSILLLDIAIIYQMLLFLGLMILMVKALRNNNLRSLQWQPDGAWLITQDHFQQKARLKQGSVVTAFFASLNFKLENNKNLTVIILKDNVVPEKFRQLRVRLKVEGIKSDKTILVSDD